MMGWKMRIAFLAIFVTTSIGTILILRLTGSDYALLDATTSLLGILITFLTLFAFVEGMYMNVLNQALCILLYISMVLNGVTEQVTYLIFGVYSFICIIITAINGRKLYIVQRNSDMPC